MDALGYLKNPIVLGILTAVLVYLYLYWEEEQKHKKNPKIEKKSVSFITPAVIGVIVWFISSSYFEKYDNGDQEKIETEGQRGQRGQRQGTQQGGKTGSQLGSKTGSQLGSKTGSQLGSKTSGQLRSQFNNLNLVDHYSGSNVVTDMNAVTDSHQSSKVDTHGIHTQSNGRLSDSIIDSKSFYLIGKNKLELPNTDVFIDVARF